jgi:hypothetical protein
MRDYQRRKLNLFDELRHRKGLTRPGNTFERLFRHSRQNTLGEFVDGLFLVSGWSELRYNVKFFHRLPGYSWDSYQYKTQYSFNEWFSTATGNPHFGQFQNSGHSG